VVIIVVVTTTLLLVQLAMTRIGRIHHDDPYPPRVVVLVGMICVLFVSWYHSVVVIPYGGSAAAALTTTVVDGKGLGLEGDKVSIHVVRRERERGTRKGGWVPCECSQGQHTSGGRTTRGGSVTHGVVERVLDGNSPRDNPAKAWYGICLARAVAGRAYQK
jgi:hypothetical protein